MYMHQYAYIFLWKIADTEEIAFIMYLATVYCSLNHLHHDPVHTTNPYM